MYTIFHHQGDKILGSQKIECSFSVCREREREREREYEDNLGDVVYKKENSSFLCNEISKFKKQLSKRSSPLFTHQVHTFSRRSFIWEQEGGYRAVSTTTH